MTEPFGPRTMVVVVPVSGLKIDPEMRPIGLAWAVPAARQAAARASPAVNARLPETNCLSFDAVMVNSFLLMTLFRAERPQGRCQ